MKRPRTVDEYVDLVKQAQFEVQDLRACLEYESEDAMQSFPAFLAPLDEGVKKLQQSMQDGSYAWGREDLPFMTVVRRHEADIPFADLLELINLTHSKGLDVVGDDKW